MPIMRLMSTKVAIPLTPSLREFLDARGIRYSWVASKLGIGNSHMTRLMDGERPLTERHALKLIELFGDEARVFLPAEHQDGAA